MNIEKDPQMEQKFPGQKPGEQIKLLVRKHWVIDIKVALTFVILGVIPLIAAIVGTAFLWHGNFSDDFLLFLIVVWTYLLFIMMITYLRWLNEELDIIIVTNERVISHDQVTLFHRQISETSISQVQDVKGVEKGFFGTLMHYGPLEIQTAAREIIFKIQDISDPYHAARIILDTRDRYLDKEKFEEDPIGKSLNQKSGPDSPVFTI